MTDDEKVALLKAAAARAKEEATGTFAQRKRAWWLALWRAVEQSLQGETPPKDGGGSP